MRRFSLLALLFAGLTQATAWAQSLTSDDFFDPAVLHEIRLTLKAEDWQTLREHYLANDYYRCRFEWRGIVVEDAGVRSRGNFNRDSVKPGLHVDFNRFVDPRDFLGLKSVVLKNSAQDPSMLRDRLGMLLLRRMGVAAPRDVHARVFVNDEYSGVYVVAERIDKGFLKRQFGENDGYLYDYEWYGGYNFEYLGADSSLYSPLPFQPRTHEKEPDPAPLVAMIQTLNFATDEEFPKAMAEFLDLPLFLKQVAAENFVGEIDGILGIYGMANFNLYRFEGKQRSQFIAWDRDNSFSDVQYPILGNTTTNVLVRRALENAGLRRSFFESALVAAAMTGGPGGWLEQEINRAYEQIRDAVYEDPVKRCPASAFTPAGPCTNDRFEAEVGRLRAFARERAEVVRRQALDAGYLYGDKAPQLSERSAVGAGGSDAAPVPGSLALVYGDFRGVPDEHAGALPLPEVLGGASVFVNGFSAPLVSTSGTRFTVQVPWGMTPGPSEVVAVFNGRPGKPARVEFAAAAPEVLAVAHPGGSAPGSVLVVYASGLGAVDRVVATGAASPSDPLAMTAATPVVTLGGAEAAVEFSGLAPGLVGIYQVNVRVPAAAPAGESTPLVIQVAGASSPPLLVTTSQP